PARGGGDAPRARARRRSVRAALPELAGERARRAGRRGGRGRALGSRAVFTIEQRDALRERVLSLAMDDDRVVAGAVVGSLAVDAGDRFSDLDMTFGVDDHLEVAT